MVRISFSGLLKIHVNQRNVLPFTVKNTMGIWETFFLTCRSPRVVLTLNNTVSPDLWMWETFLFIFVSHNFFDQFLIFGVCRLFTFLINIPQVFYSAWAYCKYDWFLDFLSKKFLKRDTSDFYVKIWSSQLQFIPIFNVYNQVTFK